MSDTVAGWKGFSSDVCRSKTRPRSTSPLTPPTTPFLPPLFPSSVYPVAILQDMLTALHYAAEGGHVACLKVLLGKGSDIMAKDKVRDRSGWG